MKFIITVLAGLAALAATAPVVESPNAHVAPAASQLKARQLGPLLGGILGDTDETATEEEIAEALAQLEEERAHGLKARQLGPLLGGILGDTDETATEEEIEEALAQLRAELGLDKKKLKARQLNGLLGGILGDTDETATEEEIEEALAQLRAGLDKRAPQDDISRLPLLLPLLPLLLPNSKTA